MHQNNGNEYSFLAKLAPEKRTKIYSERAKYIYMEHCTQQLIDAFVNYNEVQFSWLSALDVVFSKPYIGFA